VNVEFFVAGRLFFSKEKTFSKFIVGIATTAVALSVAVMIIAVSLVNGFQKEIAGKVFGYFGQIQISKFGYGQSLEDNPITIQQPFYKNYKTVENVNHLQVFAYKPGILKTSNQIEGIVLKGAGSDFKWNFIEKSLVQGNTLKTTDSVLVNEVMLSNYTAERLNLKADDNVALHFMQTPPRVRNMKVAGIYNTGMEEFDKLYALMDIRHIQELNGWNENQIAGFEVFVNNTDLIDITADEIAYNELGPDLTAQTIMEIRPNIFDWLKLQDMNELIILILMTAVACINMITCLLIIILERSNMIGVLKALGARNWVVRKIFVYNSLYIVGMGLFWGNLFGVGITLLQKHFKFITLDETSYYVKYAPVDFDIATVLMINGSTFLVCFLVLLIPSYLVSRISPVKVLRFE
jgi:lipoprotein-releasing system permease protein